MVIGPNKIFIWMFLIMLDFIETLNVHFENKDGGFFLKQLSKQTLTYNGDFNNSHSLKTILSTDRFTVFKNFQPISIRATYGPFSTKQTVPARFVVPETFSTNATGSIVELQDSTSHQLDMSAHLVVKEIPRDVPVLRVLFHISSDPGIRRQMLLNRFQQKICIVLHATLGNHPTLRAACNPDGENGVCLAQITIPSNFWPPLPGPDKSGKIGKPAKSPPRLLKVAYSILEPTTEDTNECYPKMQIQPSTVLAMVPLTEAKGAYKETKLTDFLTLLVPHPTLFPKSRIHIPVLLNRQKAKSLTAIIVRARVKGGAKLLEVSSGATETWNMTVEMNSRNTAASTIFIRKESPDIEAIHSGGNENEELLELFTWLIEINEETTETFDGTRIVWVAKFEPRQENMMDIFDQRSDGRRVITKLNIQKDDIQAVVPISQNWEILNTAALTGRQVSQPMKVFIVSQSGKAADVTFQASCHSDDDNILKVSSSCSSVYLDGSEVQGSVSGSVLVKYGTYTGIATFTVWMPEFPLDLQVLDSKLSQIKFWRIANDHHTNIKTINKRSYGSKWMSSIDEEADKSACRLRYQQTSVDVYAQFTATDHQSGRTKYLVNRRTWLRVTDLVLPLLRISDPRIGSLHGRILQGRSAGRTEIQVLSPMTGRVIGAKEIRVANDRVGLTEMTVNVVSGLQLNIVPDNTIDNGYIAETSVTRQLTAQYQEGLLDIELEFSDGTKTPLREIADNNYQLHVESLDQEVVAFAPMIASHHPRVIAIGEGGGDLLKVTLMVPEECSNTGKLRYKSSGPLSVATASIFVDFTTKEFQHKPDILQNDGGSFNVPKVDIFQDLHDIFKGTSEKDKSLHDENAKPRQYFSKRSSMKHNGASHMSILEISMYVLLAGFCCAIVVFVASCVIYASKFRTTEWQNKTSKTITLGSSYSRKPFSYSNELVSNVHDWVWLGRTVTDQTDKKSPTTERKPEIHIKSNPLNVNYSDPNDCIIPKSDADEIVVIPASGTNRTSRYECDDVVREDMEDYRPPVPPHRNITESYNNTKTVPSSKVRHDTRDQYHVDNSASRQLIRPHSQQESITVELVAESADKVDSDTIHLAKHFEFDDEVPQTNFSRRNKSEESDDQWPCYHKPVLFQPSGNNNEVKKANIIENSMFTATEGKEKEDELTEDFQLDMDYEQLLQYFKNLKESNA